MYGRSQVSLYVLLKVFAYRSALAWVSDHSWIRGKFFLSFIDFPSVDFNPLFCSSNRKCYWFISRVVSITRVDEGIASVVPLQDALSQEADLLASLDHPHVVRLFGVSEIDTGLMMVMELAPLGPLNRFLRYNRYVYIDKYLTQ